MLPPLLLVVGACFAVWVRADLVEQFKADVAITPVWIAERFLFISKTQELPAENASHAPEYGKVEPVHDRHQSYSRQPAVS
jgi:hypothetical protein